jgi:signal transduction histidine kinase
MSFSKKIFYAIFLSTLIVGSSLLWFANRRSEASTTKEFVSRYQILTKVLADNLTRYDFNTESLMRNAAKVIEEKDAKSGLLPTGELKSLRESLGVTHIFITDKNGNFIRSTNEDPKLIPNIFSFSDNYRLLLNGSLHEEATPIIKPDPEPRPFKFLSIPNRSLTRIIEVGVRVDFIGKTLSEANNSDANIISTSLYGPDGSPFGQFSNGKVKFEDKKINFPEKFDEPVFKGDSVHFFTKVASSHPKCSQCEKAVTSRNGEYFYILESQVSISQFRQTQKEAGMVFLGLGVLNFFFALTVARVLSRKIGRRVEAAVARVRALTKRGQIEDRIGIDGEDEISYLTMEFDRLLETLTTTQKQMVESEIVKSNLQLARTVAHNMKSPVLAIEMVLPTLANVTGESKKILMSALKDIRQLADKLSTDSNSVRDIQNFEVDTGLVYLPLFIQDVLVQKQIEFSRHKGARIKFVGREACKDAFAKVSSLELKSILSNVLNNAIEAYPGKVGVVEVSLASTEMTSEILISDKGAGIPEEYLKDLGKRRITFKGESSRGIGLLDANRLVESWGGKIEITSTVGSGTDLKIVLPKYSPQAEPQIAMVGV